MAALSERGGGAAGRKRSGVFPTMWSKQPVLSSWSEHGRDWALQGSRFSFFRTARVPRVSLDRRAFLLSADGSRSGLFDDDGSRGGTGSYSECWRMESSSTMDKSPLRPRQRRSLYCWGSNVRGIQLDRIAWFRHVDDRRCCRCQTSFAVDCVEDVGLRGELERILQGPGQNRAEERAQTMMVIDGTPTPAEGAHSWFEDDRCPGHGHGTKARDNARESLGARSS